MPDQIGHQHVHYVGIQSGRRIRAMKSQPLLLESEEPPPQAARVSVAIVHRRALRIM